MFLTILIRIEVPHAQTLKKAPYPYPGPNCIVAPRVCVWEVWTCNWENHIVGRESHAVGRKSHAGGHENLNITKFGLLSLDIESQKSGRNSKHILLYGFSDVRC